MYKLLIVIVLATMALTACASPTPPGQTGTEAAAVQPATPQPAAATSTAPAQATAIQATGPAECRVAAKTEPNPTIEALLPRVADVDWTKGPADASVVFTEYSDFQ